MSEEYASLREEILQWQERRFTVLSGSAALVTAVVAWDLTQFRDGDWALVSAMLLAILSCANGMTWYCGRGNSMVGAYLVVFHHEPLGRNDQQPASAPFWETGLPLFRDKIKDSWTVNRWFGLTYLVLAFVSIFIPCIAAENEAKSGIWVFVVSVCIFIASSTFVFRPSPRGWYIEKWREVRDRK